MESPLTVPPLLTTFDLSSPAQGASLSFDILHVIVDAFFSVGDDGERILSAAAKKSLSALSVTRREYLEPCRKAIFYGIELPKAYEVSPPTVRDSSKVKDFEDRRRQDTSSDFQTFRTIVEKYPHITGYVRRLRCNVLEDRPIDPEIIRLLKKFDRLEHLSINGLRQWLLLNSPKSIAVDWNSVTDPLRNTLLDLVSLSTLRSVELDCIFHFPLSALVFGGLRKLIARSSTLTCAKTPSKDFLNRSLGRHSEVEHLALHRDAQSVVIAQMLQTVCADPDSPYFALTKAVKHFHFALTYFDDVQGHQSILAGVLQTFKYLETLEISSFAHRAADTDNALFTKCPASSLATLKRLIIRHHGGIPDTRRRRVTELEHIRLLHMILLDAIPRMEQLEELQLDINTSPFTKLQMYRDLDKLDSLLLTPRVRAQLPALKRVNITIILYFHLWEANSANFGQPLVRDPRIFEEGYQREGDQLPMSVLSELKTAGLLHDYQFYSRYVGLNPPKAM